MAGTGIGLCPTGWFVVFSNSVLFQVSTPLYNQIPGTEYTWREIAVSLVPDANHKPVQDTLLGAVHSVYAGYRKAIERQCGDIERRVEIQLRMPGPEARLQFGDRGLEFMVRYPVEIRRASEVDDNITRKWLEMMATDANLKTAIAGSPKIRAALKG